MSQQSLQRIPQFLVHKRSGNARVKIQGQEIWLGPAQEPAAREKYDRVVAEWLANGRRLPPDYDAPSGRTVSELIIEYLRFAEQEYMKDGQPTREYQNLRAPLRILQRLYGSTPVGSFGPRALKTVRQAMVDRHLRADQNVTFAGRTPDESTIRMRLLRRLLQGHVDRRGLLPRCPARAQTPGRGCGWLEALADLKIAAEALTFTTGNEVNTAQISQLSGQDASKLRERYARLANLEIGLICRFGEPVKAALRRLPGVRGSGLTPLGEAMQIGAARLAPRPETRKILLVLTDGKAGCDGGGEAATTHTQHMAGLIEKAGIELVGVGILVNQGHDDIRSLLARPVILELDALTQSDKVFVASTLVLYIHHLRMTEPVRETFKSAILIEEAHHILSGERQSLAGGQSVMDIAFREIREFGTGIVLLDQMPSTITASALANTYAVLCFNLKHRADVGAISQAMLLEDQEKDILGRLQVGEAVVRLQGRGLRPFMIRVPEFLIHKGSVSDAQVEHHMRHLGLLSHRRVGRERVVPGDAATLDRGVVSAPPEASDLEAPQGEDNRERAFLRDIAAFPDSGIAERYRRLRLSVRQGQKLKDRLIATGSIQEQLQVTSRGKLRVIRLTEQGQRLADHAVDSCREAT